MSNKFRVLANICKSPRLVNIILFIVWLNITIGNKFFKCQYLIEKIFYFE